MTWHHYTDTPAKTAAAAVNAGTCLEDADSEDNIFTHVGEAVKAVIYSQFDWHSMKYVLITYVKGLISEDRVKSCTSQLFMVRMKLGEFDPAEMNPYTKYVQ